MNSSYFSFILSLLLINFKYFFSHCTTGHLKKPFSNTSTTRSSLMNLKVWCFSMTAFLKIFLHACHCMLELIADDSAGVFIPQFFCICLLRLAEALKMNIDRREAKKKRSKKTIVDHTDSRPRSIKPEVGDKNQWWDERNASQRNAGEGGKWRKEIHRWLKRLVAIKLNWSEDTTRYKHCNCFCCCCWCWCFSFFFFLPLYLFVFFCLSPTCGNRVICRVSVGSL